MHLTRIVLYVTIAYLSGIITGIVLVGAWITGWLFPVSIPEKLYRNSPPYAGDGE